MPTVSLTVVMPVVDAETRLAANLPQLASQLASAEKSLGDIELIFVDDASRDRTVECITEHLRIFSRGQLIRLPWSCGTGTAARAGVAAAAGANIAFIGDDHRADVHRLTTIVRLLKDADVLVSPRSAVNPSPTVSQRLSAAVYGRLARRLTPAALPRGQHRITALRGEVAKPLFSLLQSRDFCFDLETSVVATSMGLHVVELPVALTEAAPETFPVARQDAGLRSMARDLLRANGHRSRALNSPVSANSLPTHADRVIDLTADDSPHADSGRDPAMRRQNRAGA